MTPPFPALHAQANDDARARVDAARARTEMVGAFLDELDRLLDDVAA